MSDLHAGPESADASGSEPTFARIAFQWDWISPTGELWRLNQTEKALTLYWWDPAKEGFVEFAKLWTLRQGIGSGETLHGEAAQNAKQEKKPVMALIPNDWHPGPRCSCRSCLDKWPDA